MAKRFTETSKWSDQWYRRLPIEYKVFWSYLCDQCDNAGIWKKDIELASFYIGTKIDEQESLRLFNAGKDRIESLSSELWLITDFVWFQYGELSEDCPPHKQVLSLVNKYKEKGLAYPYIRVQDKDKDKDKGKDKEKKKTNPDVSLFINYVSETFKNKTGEKICIDGGKDGSLVKGLLRTYGLDRLKGLWDTFLASTDPFIEQAGFSIGVFKSQINKLLTKAPLKPPDQDACTRCGTTDWTNLKNIDKERICEKCLRAAKPQGAPVRNGSGAVLPGGDTP